MGNKLFYLSLTLIASSAYIIGNMLPKSSEALKAKEASEVCLKKAQGLSEQHDQFVKDIQAWANTVEKRLPNKK